MKKAYIVRYVGYDLEPDTLINELPDEIFRNKTDAVKKFNEMIAEELPNWDNYPDATIERDDNIFYAHTANMSNWTEIQIKCLKIKK